MRNPLFTEDCKTTPYWWDATPRPLNEAMKLPEKTDVLVIGAGYTGLSAAVQTARGGRETVVIDAEDIGWGCSTRNGGQISSSQKPKFAQLSSQYGAEQAYSILREGHNALDWIEAFVREEGIACQFKRAGNFLGAHTAAQYENLGKSLNEKVEGLESDSYLVSRSEQHTELGTDFYHGGMIYPNHASADPGMLHQGMLECVIAAKTKVIGHCAALDIQKNRNGFLVTTNQGTTQAKDVIVATNGYTGALNPWHRRRVIPIGSYIIATEPLAEGQMDRLIPKDRTIIDTRRLVYYYRSSPDRKRILFGGRVSLSESDPYITGPRLHNNMTNIFPELAETKISHSWVGFVAYTFDTLPHIGKHDGVYYAMGYCGSGVAMASYLGMRVGQKLLGLKEGQTGFDDLTFQTRPLYTGTPWFLSASVLAYQYLDRLGI